MTGSGGMASIYNRKTTLFFLLVDNKLVEQAVCHNVPYVTKSFILPPSLFSCGASEREFNPDIHCGVVDLTARKPCTRSLTCKVTRVSAFVL